MLFHSLSKRLSGLDVAWKCRKRHTVYGHKDKDETSKGKPYANCNRIPEETRTFLGTALSTLFLGNTYNSNGAIHLPFLPHHQAPRILLGQGAIGFAYNSQ